MPKMKTHKGAAKRFKKTAKGKIRHWRANRNHLNEHKSASRKRRLRRTNILSGKQAKNVKRLLSN